MEIIKEEDKHDLLIEVSNCSVYFDLCVCVCLRACGCVGVLCVVLFVS